MLPFLFIQLLFNKLIKYFVPKPKVNVIKHTIILAFRQSFRTADWASARAALRASMLSSSNHKITPNATAAEVMTPVHAGCRR